MDEPFSLQTPKPLELTNPVVTISFLLQPFYIFPSHLSCTAQFYSLALIRLTAALIHWF